MLPPTRRPPSRGSRKSGRGLLLEQVGIVRADQLDFAAVAGGQLAQPLLVLPARLAVRLVDVLKDADPGRGVRRRLDLAVVEEGVPAVQQPAVALPDRDAGVTERVALERDEHDLAARAGEDPDRLEAHPPIPVGVVLDPAGAVAPVRGDVAGAR